MAKSATRTTRTCWLIVSAARPPPGASCSYPSQHRPERHRQTDERRLEGSREGGCEQRHRAQDPDQLRHGTLDDLAGDQQRSDEQRSSHSEEAVVVKRRMLTSLPGWGT